MKVLNQFRILATALTFSGLVMTAAPAKAAAIKGSSGNNFQFVPTSTPGVFLLTHPGVARISILGNCTFDGEELLIPPSASNPNFVLSGTWRFTSADGASTLDAEVEGVGTADPGGANFVTLRYKVRFTGGTGKMAGARGKAEMEGVAMLTSATGGTTTFTFAGEVSTRGHKDHGHDHEDGD